MIYGILIAFVMGIGLAWWDGHTRLVDYQNAVRVVGEAQEERTKVRIESDKRRKLEADNAHKTESARLAGVIAGLRKSHSGSGGLSAPAITAASTDRICFDPAKLDRALRTLDQGVLGIVESGSQAIVDLDVAKAWIKEVQ